MSRSSQNRRNKKGGKTGANNRSTLIIGLVFVLVFAGCAITSVTMGRWAWDGIFQQTPATENAAVLTWAKDSAELTVAVNPVLAPTLAQRVEAFNRLSQKTPDGQTMQVALTEIAPEKMVETSLGQPPFQAVIPDSALWLNQIDQRWAADNPLDHPLDHPVDSGGIAPRRVGDPTRFAISPIVLAAWEDTARSLGWPDAPVGWAEIQRKAISDPNFKWNHPNTQHATGLLATLAEFYAGAGLTRGLTAEIANQQSVLDYVRDVEATVRFYGEGEDVIVQRLEQEGRGFLDAFVAQEQTVIRWNESHGSGDRLIALYPKEGTLWTDHPLALLELGAAGETAVTDNQRRTFQAFGEFLLSNESQQAFLTAGYRPADVGIDLSASGSPFAGTDAVDASQPKTTLQIPSAAVVEVVQNVWYYTKRPTNVYLVVDTSGSMAGEKMDRTRTALQSFVSQIQGDRDKVGIVEFGSGVKRFEPLRSLNEGGREQMVEIIAGMEADGYTALLDAVWQAQDDLQTVADANAINAIVVMTDGQENDSYRSMDDLRRAFENSPTPVVVFTIAFGSDADDSLLQELARIGGGQFRRADETDIEELYRILSTYF